MVRELTSLTIFNGALQTCFPCKHSSAVVSCCIVHACTTEFMSSRLKFATRLPADSGRLQAQKGKRQAGIAYGYFQGAPTSRQGNRIWDGSLHRVVDCQRAHIQLLLHVVLRLRNILFLH